MPTTIYRLPDGTRVPSVTTVIKGTLSAPALIGWANREGLAGRRINDVLAETSAEGMGMHEALAGLLCGADGPPPPGVPWGEGYQAMAAWVRRRRPGPPELIEAHLVNGDLRVGGTPDAVLPLDGVLTCIDLKTGSGIYEEHVLQNAVYVRLLQLSGRLVQRGLVLRVPRRGGAPDEFEVAGRRVDVCWELFTLLRRVYDLRPQIMAEG
jgi:hypothetical protein